jgi:hypothetical protein
MRQFLSSLRLDAQLADPLYRQIYLRIKDAIAQGSLQGGKSAAFGTWAGERSGRGAGHGGKRLRPTYRRRFSAKPGTGWHLCFAAAAESAGTRSIDDGSVAGGGGESIASEWGNAAFSIGAAGAGCFPARTMAEDCRSPIAYCSFGGHGSSVNSRVARAAGGDRELFAAFAWYQLSTGTGFYLCRLSGIAGFGDRHFTQDPVTRCGWRTPATR